MSSPKAQRRLAAILAADVVGYSGLMGEDEEGTLARIKDLRREVIEPRVKDHEGRVFKTTGDGFLAWHAWRMYGWSASWARGRRDVSHRRRWRELEKSQFGRG